VQLGQQHPRGDVDVGHGGADLDVRLVGAGDVAGDGPDPAGAARRHDDDH
jgi:hypothetical protein